MKLIRGAETKARLGQSRSGLYEQIANGLFTRPVKTGRRSSGWPEHEVELIAAARTAGTPPNEIKLLVDALHEARQTRYRALLSNVPGDCPSFAVDGDPSTGVPGVSK